MDVEAVRQEIATRLNGYGGLRAFAFTPGPPPVPCALVMWPTTVEYVQTYQRGQSRLRDLSVVVCVGAGSQRAASTLLAAYVSEAGTKSVPNRLETFTWTSCDVLTVTSCTFPDLEIAGVPVLAAEFHLDITGKGV